MKKIIATLLVATAMTAPTIAQAADGLDLGIAGYFKGYMVAAHQDTDASHEARSVDIVRDMEIHFNGSMTLDNGLVVGADVGTSADLGDSFAVTDSFVYFSDDWGRVNFGATDGVGYLLQVTAPAADPNYDGMDQYFTPFNADVTGVTQLASIEFDYDHDMSTPHDKVSYISPLWNGFQMGVSYTPEAKTSRGLDGVSAQGDEDNLENIWDVAARFGNDVSWGSYTVGAGYSHADNEDGVGAGASDPSDDRTLWNVAADLNIGAWGLGAVYTHDDRGELGGSDSDQRQWILGADYTHGDMVYAASYLNQSNEFGANDIDTQRYTGGVTWKYGPGIDFTGLVTHIDHDVDAALGDDVSGTALMLGTSISF